MELNVISEITDETFGEKSVEFKDPIIRYGARGIVEREDGKIAIFYKTKKNEYKLPGGGIDEGESPEEAFKREVLEETGCTIKDIKILGLTKELKSLGNFKQISYVFYAKVENITKKLNLTDKEKEEGSEFLWLTKEDALMKITECAEELKESKFDNIYSTKFMNYRDKEILKYYINNK